MQKTIARVSALDRRSLLLALLLVTNGFLGYIAVRLSYAFACVCLLPWALGMTYCCVVRGEVRRSAAFWLLCAMNVVLVVTTLINQPENQTWLSNYWSLLACSMTPMLVPSGTSREALSRQMLRLGTLYVVCFLPLGLIAMASVFTGQPIYVPGLDLPVGIASTGCVDGRVTIYTHPNTAGRLAAFGALIAAYGFAKKRSLPARIFYGFAMLVSLMTLAHSQSRTCFIALGAAAGALAFRAVWLRMKGHRARILAGLIAAAVVLVAVVMGLSGLYKADVAVARRTAVDVPETIAASHLDDGEFEVFSTGRDVIWISALKYLCNHPRYLLTGLGPVDMTRVMGQEFPDMLPHLNLHNSYLNCLAQCGVVYALLMLALLCTLVRPALRMLTRPDPSRLKLFFAPAFVCMLLCMAIPENMLFATPGLGNFFFFLMSGYLLSDSETEQLGGNK